MKSVPQAEQPAVTLPFKANAPVSCRKLPTFAAVLLFTLSRDGLFQNGVPTTPALNAENVPVPVIVSAHATDPNAKAAIKAKTRFNFLINFPPTFHRRSRCYLSLIPPST